MAYLQTRLGRWFFEEQGETKRAGDATIVLLPSLLCDGSMWRGQLAPLRELGRVVVFDGPGHGKSEVPPPFTLEDNARALGDALDALGVARVVIVGLSWGGMLAMRFALSSPARLAAMAIFDTSADGTLLRERIEYRALCLLASKIGLPPALVRKKIVPLMFADGTRAREPALVDGFVRDLCGFVTEGVTRAATAVSIDRPSILDQIGAIKAPTLIGVGAEDVATSPDHARRIADRIIGSTLVSFPGLGHLSALEDPAAVNAVLVPFVRDHLVAS